MSFKNLVGGAGFLLLMAASSAWANTAANTRITNSADLTYNDGTGTKHATSQVTVTVALKPSAPTITALAAQSGAYGTSLVDDYVITNNSNGPDTFILATTVSNLVNSTAATATPGAPAPTTPVTLGATVTVAGSSTANGTTYLVVPSDGVTDSAVNGIRINDKVVVNGEEVKVTGILDNANGTSTIEVAALTAAAPGPGVVVGQRITVHATVAPNNITASGQNVSFDVAMKATSQADGLISATSNVVSNIFYSGSATLVKYVRNVTNPNGTGGSTTSVNGFTYFYNPTTLTAKPGDTLEYLLVATDSSLTAAVTGVTLTDLVPIDYVALSPGAFAGKAFRYYPDAAGTTTIDYTSAGGDDAVDYDTTTDVTKGKITAWLGGAAPAYSVPGTVAAGKSFMLLYQVSVK